MAKSELHGICITCHMGFPINNSFYDEMGKENAGALTGGKSNSWRTEEVIYTASGLVGLHIKGRLTEEKFTNSRN